VNWVCAMFSKARCAKPAILCACISAQLIDAASGVHLWADRFDGPLEDIFELQDNVAVSVAGIIEPTLEVAETRRSADRPTNDLTALDFYLRALPEWDGFTKSGLLRALNLLGQAIERDPHYGPALAVAACCHQALEVNGWAEDPEATRRTSVDLARRALRGNPEDPNVLALTAFVLGYCGEDIDVSLGLIDRCLTLNPSSARGWHWSALLRVFAGQPDTALEHFQNYLRLSPRDRMATYLNGIGEAYFFSRRFDEAAANLLASLDLVPSFPGDLSRARVLRRAYGPARRCAGDRQAAACDHACRHGTRNAVSKPGTPRAVPVRSAPGGRRSELSRIPHLTRQIPQRGVQTSRISGRG
jgi:tetratricopeptide (TPR) repeat protein